MQRGQRREGLPSGPCTGVPSGRPGWEGVDPWLPGKAGGAKPCSVFSSRWRGGTGWLRCEGGRGQRARIPPPDSVDSFMRHSHPPVFVDFGLVSWPQTRLS
jgi:hypothetical protein